jgi:outer membrane receptor protein involved in Fe transport
VFTNFGWIADPWSFSLRWRHLPSVESVQRAIAGSNPIPFLGADSYNVFDLSGSRAIGDRFDLRFGLDNVLDEEPAITGAQDSTGGNRPTSGQGTTEAGFYDILGRRLYVGFQMSF